MTAIARVAHVVTSMQVGGAERLVVDLSGAQRRAGLEAWILNLGGDDEPLVAEARADGVEVVSLGARRSRFTRVAALGALLAGRPGQAVHVHNPWALRTVLPVLPAVLGRVLYTRHGASRYDHGGWPLLHRVARRLVDHVTFVTDDVRRAFEAAHGAWPGRVVVENGVVVVRAREVARPRGRRLRIGTVGRLVALKGQDLVIDAIAGLAPADRAKVELHLFGDGPERARLADRAKRRLAKVPVAFHGAVLDREKIYAAIDVLVVGSRTEGMSLAVMEAMAHALPVVATDVGGNRTLVRDGITGLLVPPADSAALGAAITRLVGVPALAARLGRAARDQIATHYSIDVTAARYRPLYDTST